MAVKSGAANTTFAIITDVVIATTIIVIIIIKINVMVWVLAWDTLLQLEPYAKCLLMSVMF